jgi:glycosyltransferase involved in cell wall biosynthesis
MILTIDKESYKTLFPTNPANIINIGPISQKSCPSIYAQADALFAPTILETFSAAYPEAMKMRIPILTSDYSFTRDVCNDAALYFNPLDEKDIMIKIEELIKNNELKNKLIENGEKQLMKFETSSIKAKKYIQICENIIKKEKHV